jgi:hypothetical protein
MKQVFVSYSRKDKDFAYRITTTFTDRGIDSWIDWEDIPPSVDWMVQIQKGIEEADVFVFIVSPDSVQSKVCEQEVEHAIKNGKRIIPVIVRDIETQQAHNAISHLNWIFFREQDHYENSFEKLITAIQTDYDWVQVHRRLQMKALEWKRNGCEDSFLLRGKDLQDAEAQLLVNSEKNPIPTELQKQYVSSSRADEDRKIESQRVQEQQLFLEKSTGTRLRRLTFILLGIFTVAFIALFFWINKITTDVIISALSDHLKSIIQTGELSIDPQEFTEVLKVKQPSEGLSDDPLFLSHQAILQKLKDLNPHSSLFTITMGENADEITMVGSSAFRNWDEAILLLYAIKKDSTIYHYDTLAAGLKETTVDSAPTKNDWGYWMTGCTPIKDTKSQSLGALCADFDSSYVNQVRSNVTKTLIVAFLSIYPIVVILILSTTQVLKRITFRIRKSGNEN